MSHAKNKLEWCLKKAEKELKESKKHRGLLKVKPDVNKARAHIKKAEHYLKATNYLKKGNFSDISTSTMFYSIYHCLLAITIKFGYESRNQECTFTLMNSLMEDGKIDFNKELLNKISTLEVDETTEKTTVEIREEFQYGTKLSIGNNLYKELYELTVKVIEQTKRIIES